MFRKFALAALMIFGVGSAAKADITIDTFTDASTSNYLVGPSSPVSFSPVLLGNGLTRDVTITVVSPVPPDFNSVGGTIGGGSFSVDINNSSLAFATLTYSGVTSDFSSGTGIQLDFINLNPGNTSTSVALDMPISVSMATSTGSLTSTISVAGSGAPFSVFLPFASFSGTGSLNSVTSTSIQLNSGDAGGRFAPDFVLDNVSIPTNAVPAPPALLLALSAAPILMLRRWASKKTVA